MKHKIAIHSVPRSGSTWLGEIFNSHKKTKYCFQPLFSYEFKDFITNVSSISDVENFFDLLSRTNDKFVCQKSEREVGSLPDFEKISVPTHVIYKEVRYHHLLEHLCELDVDLMFVLLVRNPIEVMSSWISTPKEFDPSWNSSKELLKAEYKNAGKPENFYGLDAWIDTTKLFEFLAERYSDRVRLVNYKQLKNDPENITKYLFEFCSLNYDETTELFLQDSSRKKVEGSYSVFRGGSKSKLALSDELLATIEVKVKEAGLEHYLL